LRNNIRIGLKLFVQPPATKAYRWRRTVSLKFCGFPTLMIRSGWEMAMGCFPHVRLDATMGIILLKKENRWLAGY